MNALKIVQKYFPDVRRIVDATEDLVVHVKQVDAKGADPKEPDGCVLANAVCRDKGADGAIISLKIAYVKRGRMAERYACSSPITREVVTYDKSGSFATGAYTLTPPPASQRLGAPRATPKGTRGAKKRTLKRRFHTEGIRAL